MQYTPITSATVQLDQAVADECGALVVNCVDAGGMVSSVVSDLSTHLDMFEGLEATTNALAAEHSQVAQASQEAKLLAAAARDNIASSARQVTLSVDEFRAVVSLIERLGEHVTSFAGAMEQVRAVSGGIEHIAKTTNMLALNAAIEAERAGGAGRTFAVVAAEVKKLAQDTRSATVEIRRTIGSLTDEAEGLVRQIGEGVAQSRKAEAGFETIATAMDNAINLVGLVDGQSDQIAQGAAHIQSNTQNVRTALANFGEVIRADSQQLTQARNKLREIELQSSNVFHSVVATGASAPDWEMVERAHAIAQEIVAVTEAALRNNTLSEHALFSSEYRVIPGSNPERFQTPLMPFAHREWRPIYDRAKEQSSKIISCSSSDMTGWLPAHISVHSREPTGDYDHDYQFCRNGRRFWEEEDIKAKASSLPFLLCCYRQDLNDRTYRVVRDVFVPLYFNGRRWGDFELAYQL